MTFYKNWTEYTAPNGNTLHVYEYCEKFAPRSFWGVSYSRPGSSIGYPLRDGLLNKPNARQIARYLETISY